jgi:hypothetical protein
MHMARRAAGWAAWTCNTGIAGYSHNESGLRPAFFCGLDQMLGPGDLQPTRDIAAITVSRWPHAS